MPTRSSRTDSSRTALRAKPKSMSDTAFTGSDPSMMTLAGLTSRCTTPASWATLSALAMSMPIRSTALTDSRPDLSIDSRVWPWTRGCTR